jgi:para-nitrobenzyl esterase
MQRLGSLVAFLIALVPLAAHADQIRVTGGLVSGSATPDGVRTYLGIPYAKAPVGELRWRAPEPPAAWTGVRDATAFQPLCMQPAATPGDALFSRVFFRPVSPMSEDCLYLNIWTTAKAGSPPQAVMVWLPGGGFRGGSANDPLYDGARLARRGVIVVSINYRLWRFGFFAHPQLTAESGHGASGNYGLMDQIAALQWVQSNIAAFGGDPKHVTVFGQSAGSIAVSYLLVSPLARGLFQRAIGESGAGFAPSNPGSILSRTLISLADSEASGVRLASALGAADIETLRHKTADDILNVDPKVRAELTWPTLDGYVLPTSVDDVYAAGRQMNVPVLTGSNADEGSLFPSVATLDAYLARTHAMFGPLADAFLKLYPASDDTSAHDASEASVRDAFLGWANWTWVNEQARTGTAPAYYYYFERHPPAPPNEHFVEEIGSRVGAYHGSELAYTFGNFIPDDWTWTADDRAFSTTIQSYWVNFAKTGTPNGPGLPNWPAFDPKRPRVMIFDTTAAMGPIPNLERYAFWQTYKQSNVWVKP